MISSFIEVIPPSTTVRKQLVRGPSLGLVITLNHPQARPRLLSCQLYTAPPTPSPRRPHRPLTTPDPDIPRLLHHHCTPSASQPHPNLRQAMHVFIRIDTHRPPLAPPYSFPIHYDFIASLRCSFPYLLLLHHLQMSAILWWSCALPVPFVHLSINTCALIKSVLTAQFLKSRLSLFNY